MRTIPSERLIIQEIRKRVQVDGGHGLVKGIGDDCAVLRGRAGFLEVVTIDTLVEAVHFDLAWHSPELLGRKAVSVNASDIAAMGALPRYALLSLALPPATEDDWLNRFMDGFATVLRETGAVLMGGDTVRSEKGLVISVTMFGEVAEHEILYRSGARPGDLVWVSGFLGEAAAGLELCRRNFLVPPGHQWERLVAAHLDPMAQVELGRTLAQSGMVRAMMDLSDGLATDLAHLCKESGVGAEVLADELSVSSELRLAAEQFGLDPLEWALTGGEDYQLLIVAPPEHEESLAALAKNVTGREIRQVGRIVDGAGVVLVRGGARQEIAFRGFDHFTG